MTLVLVHGVPETSAVWTQFLGKLTRSDVVSLDLPGFGSETPPEFTGSKDEYVDWLLKEIEGIAQNGPVDLLGHDWGGALVVRAAALRPEWIRSSVSDAVAVADLEFTWHEAAQVWQTPSEGEEYFARLRKGQLLHAAECSRRRVPQERWRSK